MENNDYKKLYELFSDCGAYPKFDVNTEEIRTLDFAGTAMQCRPVGPTTITMSAVFRSPDGFSQFVRYMNRLSDLINEEHLRRHNPTLQQAFEEYQLLLKLTR